MKLAAEMALLMAAISALMVLVASLGWMVPALTPFRVESILEA